MRAAAQAVDRLLNGTWAIIFVPFAALVARFSFERGCRDPYELLQPIMQRQAGALIVASIYLAAYAWFVSAVVSTLRQHDPLAPRRDTDGIWGSDRWKVLAMGGALIIDNMPRAFWNWIYAAFGAC